MNKTFDKPFREDLGLDAAGFHRIRMGNTVYCVKNNEIYILNTAGELNRVDEATLTAKSWIRRNVNEVLGAQKITARFICRLSHGYKVDVNGTEYIIKVSADFSKGFDRNVFEKNAPTFSWLNCVVVVESGMHKAAPVDLVNSLPFQTAVKSVLNPQRKLDRVTRHHSFDQWRSKRECRDYRNKQHNTDASGTSFK
ncbi:hypothetical protein EXE25_16885 [Acinetobacter bouvetii]|uniref:Uncharacterized protein n=1 Tax=Acinetobacter bouvetii TaxID=202951 RepID=A0A4Q7ANJ6_9GAMM|nr:hypothetical protein [Acinetobacter bouvetii]RZG64347.1 hypothetical protein EXE25_16885 [Acinetobacter bouvetii]